MMATRNTQLEEKLWCTCPTIIGRSGSDAACFDPITTRQQKSQPAKVGFFTFRSTTWGNSMWSGRWESNTWV